MMKSYEDYLSFLGTDIPVVTLMPREGVALRQQRILMVYGGSTKEDQRTKIAKFWGENLTERGFILHCFDFRSNLDASQFYTYGLHDRLEDTRAVYDWLLRSTGVPCHDRPLFDMPLSLMGVSMGGYLAVRVASVFAHRMHALILVAPAAYHDQACQPDVRFGPEFSEAIRNPSHGWGHCAAFKEARLVTADCLIVSYAQDEIVPAEIPESYALHMHSQRHGERQVAEQHDRPGYALRHEILGGFTHRGTFDNSKKRKRISRLLTAFFDDI